MAVTVFILISYLIGSLTFAMIVSRAFSLPDPHSYGSGNPGATNVLRTGSRPAALLTFIGDAGKGGLAVLLAGHFAPQYGVNEYGIAACTIAVFLGHLLPVFFGFKGGKGVATAAGILFAIDLWLGVATVVTFCIIALFFRYVSLASIIAAVFAPCYTFYLFGISAALPPVILIGALLVWRHRDNILRLAAGTERRMGGNNTSIDADVAKSG